MSDLELRVSALERDMSALKARVTIIDEDMKNIPNLIKTEFRFTNTQIARLSSEVAELQELRGDVQELQRKVGELSDLPAKVDAMPRVIAELVAEMLAERDRKS
jgi:prefoldin subunit 5